MDEPKPTDADHNFFDASDDFSFFDCLEPLKSPHIPFSLTQSTISDSKPPNSDQLVDSTAPGLRRRRSMRERDKIRKLNHEFNDTMSGGVVDSVNDEMKERDWKLNCAVNEIEGEDVKLRSNRCETTLGCVVDILDTEMEERDRKLDGEVDGIEGEGVKLGSNRVETTSNSVVGSVNSEMKERDWKLNEIEGEGVKLGSNRVETTSDSDIGGVNMRESNDGQFSLLVFVAEMIVKAVGFQFNLLINFVVFPFWVLYYSCMLALNPFYVVGIGRGYVVGKWRTLWKLGCNAVSPFVSDWFKEHKSFLKFAIRCGWGLIWSVYVCSILVVLLASAFVISGLMMKYYLMDHPFELRQGLNFDYTKTRPVALVPITTCPSVKDEFGKSGSARVIAPNHKLQATVTLILPESDYNRNLGIFQVRIDFLSDNGKSLASLSHPCMLEFKSQPIRLLLTFFKIVPLVAGYVSESQTLDLKFKGYKEGVIPTACVKVTIEQRAEFRPGAGIPEVYDAFVHLESELPFHKRFLWNWRKTIFVWLGLILFLVELLCALVCCRPLVIPRARTTAYAARRNSPQTRNQVQR